MSSRRGDGVVNPKPIPDLAAPGIVSRDPESRALETFIRGLIVEEFDGSEPPPGVLDALGAYVRAIDPKACGSDVPVDLETMLLDTRSALAAAATAFELDDRETALILVAAARSTLGRIDERFSLTGLEASHALLLNADGELRAIRLSKRPTQAIAKWQQQWPQRERQLRRHEFRSLFSPSVLRSRLPVER